MSQKTLAVLVVVAALVLSACGSVAADPAATKAEKGAVAAMTAYLEARKAADFARAYKYLSVEARKAYSQAEMSAYYEGVAEFNWGKMSAPKAMDENWVRIIVSDIKAKTKNGQSVHEIEYPYYLNYSEGRWGVALVNPMLGSLNEMIKKNASGQEVFDFTKKMLVVNPWSYRAYLEQFDLFMGAGDAEAAQAAIEKLYLLATPSDLPEVNALRALLMIETGNMADGKSTVKLALEMADKYPERYKNGWRAYRMLELARAHKGLNEHEDAKKVALEAYKLDPNNRFVKKFLQDYGIPMP